VGFNIYYKTVKGGDQEWGVDCSNSHGLTLFDLGLEVAGSYEGEAANPAEVERFRALTKDWPCGLDFSINAEMPSAKQRYFWACVYHDVAAYIVRGKLKHPSVSEYFQRPQFICLSRGLASAFHAAANEANEPDRKWLGPTPLDSIEEREWRERLKQQWAARDSTAPKVPEA
jgi:hypothetical protein